MTWRPIAPGAGAPFGLYSTSTVKSAPGPITNGATSEGVMVKSPLLSPSISTRLIASRRLPFTVMVVVALVSQPGVTQVKGSGDGSA